MNPVILSRRRLIQGLFAGAALYITTEGASLLLLPALNIERSVAERGLDLLEGCL